MVFTIIFLLFAITNIVKAGYAGGAGSSSGNVVAGSGAAGGYGYGYGYNGGGFQQPFPFDVSQLINGYFDIFANQHQALLANPLAIAYTSVSIDPPFRGTVFARSRITFDGLNQIQNQVHNLGYGLYQNPQGNGASQGHGYAYGGSGSVPSSFAYSSPSGGGGYYGGATGTRSGDSGYPGTGGYSGGYGGGYSGGKYGGQSGGYVPQGAGGYQAGASASIGGGNVQQSAFLNPENPASPNLFVRFAGADNSQDGGNGFRSVFTSSSSGSSNLDGKETHFRHASTTVNDNGKVSTYQVHDRK